MVTLRHAFDTEAAHAEELLIVDGDVQDVDILLTGLARPMDVVHLEHGLDPISQITRALTSRFGTRKLHVLAHGKPGALALAGVQVDTAYLTLCRSALDTIKFALAGPASISLWSCSVGEGEAGKAFTSALSAFTGADVYAATGPVGSAEKGGSWHLTASGLIAASPFMKSAEAAYPHALPTFDFSGGTRSGNTWTESDNGDGVTMTVTANGGASWTHGSAGSETTGQSIFTSTGGYYISSATFTFSTGVNITEFYLGALFYSTNDDSYTITVTSGTGSTINLTPSDFTLNGRYFTWVRPTDWQDVTSFTITAVDGQMDIVLDSLTYSTNEAPALGGTPADDTATEDVATAIDLSAYNVSDSDGDTLTITLAVDRGSIASTDGNGTFSGVTVASSGTASMTLQGTAANLNTYLNDTSKITFTTASNDTTSAVLTVTPNDGTVDGSADTVTISITSQNDNPTISSAPTDITVTEDTASNVDISASNFVDVDSTGSVTVTLTASAGTLAATSGGGVTVSGSGTSSLTLTGTIANINNYLDTASNVTYTGAANVSGNDAATLTVMANDGDGSGDVNLGTINLDISDVNDAASIGGALSASLGEDDDTVGGTATATDLDNNDDSFQADTISGTYGDLTIGSDGAWSYDLDSANNDVQALNSGDTLTDTLAIQSEDGTSQNITITINGANDAATSFGGNLSGSLGEDDDTIGGTVTVSDADNNDDVFQTDTVSGTYGELTIGTDGTWSYDLDSANNDVQALNSGDTLTDTLSIQSEDGTSQNITITINGANDAATIGGNLSGSLGEDADTVGGTATATDADNNDDTFQAETVNGTYGDLVIGSDGSWSYDLDSSNNDVQALNSGDTLTDTLAVQSEDGTSQNITITINGTNDAATSFGGNLFASLSEDDDTIGGTATVTDVDNSDNSFMAGTHSGNYGALTIDASGNWTYDLSEGNDDVQALSAGESLSDTIGIQSEDGTSQNITITINGASDAANFGGNLSGSLGEDDDTIGGTVTVSDADNNNDVFQADTVNGTYGELTIAADGTWSYDLDSSNDDVQALNTGDTLTDTLAIRSEDGTTQNIVITINGANDTATSFGGDLSATLGEDDDTIGGTATVSDTDNSNNVFQSGTVSGTYGELTIGSDGGWSYNLDSTHSAVTALNSGDTLTDTITIRSEDGTSQDVTITIHGASDPATIGGTLSASLGEDDDTVGGTATATDADNNDDVFEAETISGSYGELTIGANGVWSYDLDSANNDVQALDSGDTLNDTITIRSEDGTAQDITITINGANDAPTGTDHVMNINEDVATTISASQFGFSDVDSGDTLSSVRIDSLPANGTLTLSGNAVSVGDTVSALDLAFGLLVFTPGANENGSEYAHFTFSVGDGTSFSENSNTITIHVTSVNDAPSALSLRGASVSENDPGAMIGTLFVEDDSDGAISLSVSDDRFLVEGTSLRLAPGVSLDHEATPTVSVTVTATDTAGASTSETYSIQVLDVNELKGGQSNDTLNGSAQGDDIGAGAGDDMVLAGDGQDTIDGGSGDDDVSGGSDNDLINGGAGQDTVDGGSGADTLRGGAGDDEVSAGSGNDLVYAGAGDDGDDTVEGAGGADSLGGGAGNDAIMGGDGNDVLWGRAGSDVMSGDAGDDDIFNGTGNDSVDGGVGDDTLWAGAGDDTLTGGDGADTFIFGATAGSDRITDFDASEDVLHFAYSGAGFGDVSDVVAAATAVTVDGVDGVLIDLGGGDSVFLVGATTDQLSGLNYVF